MTGSPAPAPFIGTCPVKGCRTTVRLVAEQVLVPVRSRFGSYEAYQPRFMVPGTAPGWVNCRPLSLDEMYRWGAVPCCVAHRRPVVLRAVRGTLNPDKKCDARCTNARRPDCECSCGGANHGGGW